MLGDLLKILNHLENLGSVPICSISLTPVSLYWYISLPGKVLYGILLHDDPGYSMDLPSLSCLYAPSENTLTSDSLNLKK